MTGSLTVDIVICTHNRSALLEQTLRSLARVTPAPSTSARVLVIANACTDNTVEVVNPHLQDFPFPLSLIVEPTPGLSVARNRAMQESVADIVAFIDDDVQLNANWLCALSIAYSKLPEAGIIGGKVDLWWDALERPEWLPESADSRLSRCDLGIPLGQTSPMSLVGANFTTRRSAALNAGPFRADLGRKGKSLVGGEELEFANRVISAGYTVNYAPDMSLKHWVQPERVSMKYLWGVSRGNAIGSVLMKRPMKPSRALRSMIGHAALVCMNAPIAAVAYMIGARRNAAHRWLLVAVGTGGLVAWLKPSPR